MATIDHEQLILQFLTGSISAKEKAQLDAWIAESPEHKKVFEETQKVWHLTQTRSKAYDFETESEWEKLSLELDKVDITTTQQQRKIIPFSFLKVAATIALVIGSFLALYLLLFSASEVVIASGAERIEVKLPDGSSVWLNKESELAYQEDFEGTERIVKLKGEAFFDVVRNTEKPFIINVPDAEVKVLGTSFNVKAYKQAAKEVYVVTGKVSFASEKEELILTPGEKGIWNNNQMTLIQADHPNEIAWKTQQLVFKKTQLKEVISTVETYFGIQIEVKNPALFACRFTSSFDKPSLEEVLEALQLSLHLKITGNKNNYSIDGEGCQAP